MIPRLLLVLFLVFAGLMALAAFVVQAFGWIGLLAVLGSAAVGGYVFARFLPRFLMAAFTAPLRRMGQVLAGATVKVNAFLTAEPPAQFENLWNEEGELPFEQNPYGANFRDRYQWYTLDVTITPASSMQGEPETLTGKKWQPDALLVVPADEAGSSGPNFLGGLPHLATQGMCLVAEKLIWDGLEFVAHDGEEVWGIQRLRLHLGIPKDVTRIAFVYQMFVRFGDIPVPPRSNALQGG